MKTNNKLYVVIKTIFNKDTLMDSREEIIFTNYESAYDYMRQKTVIYAFNADLNDINDKESVLFFLKIMTLKQEKGMYVYSQSTEDIKTQDSFNRNMGDLKHDVTHDIIYEKSYFDILTKYNIEIKY